MESPLDVRLTADRLRAAQAATLGETGARTMGPAIRAVWRGAAVAGPAYTAECPAGDNLATHAAVARAPGASVLVIATQGDTAHGGWGEILATAALSRGLAGLVTDGGVRDVDALERLAFPAFAAAVSLAGTTKSGGGSTGRAVRVGGVTVETGDWVVGDADGVVVVPRDQLETILQRAQARTRREAAYLEKLRGGATTLELLDLEAAVHDRVPLEEPRDD